MDPRADPRDRSLDRRFDRGRFDHVASTHRLTRIPCASLDTSADSGQNRLHVPRDPAWHVVRDQHHRSEVRAMRKTLLAAFAAIITVSGLAFAAAPAQASTGGAPDGDLHPDVGLIAFYDGEGRWRCSATLVSPTVVITAAHCTLGTLGKTLVTFDRFLDGAPPSFLPTATDPAVGYTAEELAAAGYISGTAHTHPEYSDFTDTRNWNDVGVIVLDEPVASHGDDYPQ